MARLCFFLLLFTLSSARANAPGTAPSPVDRALDAYVDAFYLAEGKLADFDAELDAAYLRNQPDLLVRSRTYKELLALRMLLDEHAHAIAETLEALPPGDPGLAAFGDRLDGLDAAETIAAEELLSELGKVKMEMPVFFEDLDEVLAARAEAHDLIARRTAAARANDALATEVRALADALDFNSGRWSGGPIKPGAGPKGTINGAEFPGNTWALTYDDGPSEKYTPQVLQNLAHAARKASFMWLVQNLQANPGLPAQARALGMPLNDHSWTHANLAKAVASSLTKEIVASAQQDAKYYGAPPRFFRLPYGSGLNSKPVRQLIAANGMIHVFWNVDSLDWQDKDPQSILARVKKEMTLEKHGIILFHDIHPQSVVGSKLVLDWSATLEGGPAAHRWVTIPQIVDELNR